MIRAVGKFLGRLVLLLVVAAAGLWLFGPYEPVDVDVAFDAAQLDGGVDAYLAAEEARFDDLTEGTEKQVVWAGAPGQRTKSVVLYVHGFSASLSELRPVPDRVAKALGANLVFTRLTGHGRPGEHLAEATVGDWMRDTAEALAVARAVGDEVVVMTTSTGGTLMAEAALHPDMVRGVKGIIFVSPNFALNNPLAFLLTWPGIRYVLPALAGAERSWDAQSPEHAKYWTTTYPTTAVLPLAALVKHAAGQDYSGTTVPALFYYSPADQVVVAEETRAIADSWGGGATTVLLPDDADVVETRHVIAGDIRSPGNTDAAVAVMLDWLKGL